eukprot:CAMPEP_0172452808 /NCGR_PEP_ID=MMETSP1065-20121228/10360_1 /TAXON_ID=265537 /ORGANISM="Amphiprora paludosa, Strain CCMP125" /LENGTH=146 /DNA_ID=CAMNT_0013204925 /DNA_START=254 /DNA_END=692 /DNA_ORIENTATION=-
MSRFTLGDENACTIVEEVVENFFLVERPCSCKPLAAGTVASDVAGTTASDTCAGAFDVFDVFDVAADVVAAEIEAACRPKDYSGAVRRAETVVVSFCILVEPRHNKAQLLSSRGVEGRKKDGGGFEECKDRPAEAKFYGRRMEQRI